MFPSPRRVLALSLASAALLAATGADAQRANRQRAPEPAPAPQIRYGINQTRGAATYSAPPGYRGIITSSTPNESGNFGGPGTGGGGGSP